jgi:porin
LDRTDTARRPRRHSLCDVATGSAAALLLFAAHAASAQPAPAPAAAAAPAPAPTGLWDRSNLLGDLGGLRTAWADHGITLGLSETSEVFGNVAGGIRQGADYDGMTQAALQIDTGKAFGLDGGTFNASALQIHGRNLSADNLGTIQSATGIEAARSTRLWELWYQQAFAGGRVDVRIGQQSIDQEFMISQGSALFINTVTGWPALPTADLYASGPVYPLSAPGVRLRAKFSDAVTLLAGVFDDNPPGGPFANDPQLRGAEASGTAFNLNTGALWIAELQYAINQPPPADSNAPPPAGLPGTYKIGFWYDTGAFPDQHVDTKGLSLANPASSGIARMHQGNVSVYAVADQTVWQPDPQGAQALGVFARVMGAPADRNLISFSANAGVTLKAPLPGRDNDTAGIGFGVAQVSGNATNLDRDTAFFTGTPYPLRGTETFIEATYQVQVTPWWQVQPDVQYVFNSGGGVPNPKQPGKRIGDAAVLGLRTVITF